MVDTSEVQPKRSDPDTQPPNYKAIFLSSFAAALGTILAGLIISSGAVNAIASLFRSNELPKNAIIFVT